MIIVTELDRVSRSWFLVIILHFLCSQSDCYCLFMFATFLSTLIFSYFFSLWLYSTFTFILFSLLEFSQNCQINLSLFPSQDTCNPLPTEPPFNARSNSSYWIFSYLPSTQCFLVTSCFYFGSVLSPVLYIEFYFLSYYVVLSLSCSPCITHLFPLASLPFIFTVSLAPCPLWSLLLPP